MSEKPVFRSFIFNGSATAFAPRIRKPDDLPLPSAAPCHLASIGGISETVVEGKEAERFFYKDVITFTRARSHAQGEYLDTRKAAELAQGADFNNELPARVTTESSLEGLCIKVPPCPEKKTPARIFRAKSLQLSLETISNVKNPPSFPSMVAVYEGLSLQTGDGERVPLAVRTVTEMFGQYDTKQKLMDAFAKDADFRKKYAACFYPPGADLPGILSGLLGRNEIPYSAKGTIKATYVDGVDWVGKAPDGTEITHNRLTISGLGEIHFGEIFLNTHHRRPNLLRFELGPCTGGQLQLCDVSMDNSHWPPD